MGTWPRKWRLGLKTPKRLAGEVPGLWVAVEGSFSGSLVWDGEIGASPSGWESLLFKKGSYNSRKLDRPLCREKKHTLDTLKAKGEEEIWWFDWAAYQKKGVHNLKSHYTNSWHTMEGESWYWGGGSREYGGGEVVCWLHARQYGAMIDSWKGISFWSPPVTPRLWQLHYTVGIHFLS